MRNPFRRKWRAVFRDQLTREITWVERGTSYRSEGDALVASTKAELFLWENEYPSAAHEDEGI